MIIDIITLIVMPVNY